MQAQLANFIQLLRSHELRVSPAETLDAVRVTALLGYSDKRSLRDGLAMSLAKTAEEETIFNRCFELFYSSQLADMAKDDKQQNDGHPSDTEQADPEPEQAGSDTVTAADALLRSAAEDSPALQAALNSPLMQQLQGNDRNELTLAIQQAGESSGLKQISLFTQKGQFVRKILDQLGEESIRSAVVELENQQSPALNELQNYRERLRQQVRDHVDREYLLQAEGKNKQYMDSVLANARLSNLEHAHLHKIQELVRKMAKRLASKHSRQPRRFKRGQLNVAKTIRAGIAQDGVMFDTHWRKVKKDKPQIIAICDVSGSVAAYAKFLLLFLYSLQDVLPKVRSFAFSSHLGEVSDLFAKNTVEKAVELVNWKYGGATDYGSSLEDFAQLAMADINRNTTVIILGDARNNNGDPRLDIVQAISQRVHRLIWLNPESKLAWGSGDSEMLRYQRACHSTAECSSLVQLEKIVDELMRIR